MLNESLHLHIVPINLVVFKGSYLFETMGYLILDVYKRQFLSSAEVGGIPGVAVECVDIGRNTSGEGGLLGTN